MRPILYDAQPCGIGGTGDGLAALLELPLLVYGVRAVGGRWQQILDAMQRWQGFVLSGAVLLALAVFIYLRWRRARNRRPGD